MRHIVYTLRFTGHATPLASSPGTLKATTTAPSCGHVTAVGPQGVGGADWRVAGDAALFESTLCFTDATAFTESGVIAFGENGHRLRFRTLGYGYLGPSPDPTQRQGSVIWQVEGGEGQFAGAQGLITSNFLVGAGGEVVDTHVGVIFMP